VNLLLYYITDRSQFPGDEVQRRRRLLEKIAEATRAGVDFIQLREKDLSGRELETLARQAMQTGVALRTENRQLTTEKHSPGAYRREPKTRLLVNSRTDVALATGADGVHLRSVDISPSEVRGIWNGCGARAVSTPPSTGSAREAPKAPIVAVSCHTADDVEVVAKEQADFAVFAPVFAKRAAPGTPAAGLEVLRQACRHTIPVLALGGVTLQNARRCLDAGAAGIAAIRLFQENEIVEVVRALRKS
jgi:thiamine-phosphate pyrophosphorylase